MSFEIGSAQDAVIKPFSINREHLQRGSGEDGRKKVEEYLAGVAASNERYVKHQLRQAVQQARGVRFVPAQVVNAIYRSAMHAVKVHGSFVMPNGKELSPSVPMPSYTVPTMNPIKLRQAAEALPASDQDLYRSMMQFSLDDTGLMAETQGEQNA